MSLRGDRDWLAPAKGGTLLAVKVRPGSRERSVGDVVGGRLRVAVTVPPEKGKANKELIALLAEKLNVPKREVEIKSGETSREKTVMLHGLEPATVRARLGI